MKTKIFLLLSVLCLFYISTASASMQIDCDGYEEDVPFVIEFNDKKIGYNPITKEKFDDFNVDKLTSEEIDNMTLDEIRQHPSGKVNFGIDSFGPLEGEGKAISSYGAMFVDPKNGEYEITVYGDSKLTSYTLSIGVDFEEDGFDSITHKGIIDAGKQNKFVIEFNSTKKEDTAFIKNVDSNGLIQDINLSHKIGWISNEGIYKSLLKKAEMVKETIDKGRQLQPARNTLKAMLNELEAQVGKKHIDEKAITILKEDIEYLLKEI